MFMNRIVRRSTTVAKTIDRNVRKRQKVNNGFLFKTSSYCSTKNTWSHFQSFQNAASSNIILLSKNKYLHEIKYKKYEKENHNSEDNNKKFGHEDEYASFKLLSGSLACLGLANLLCTSTKAEIDDWKKSDENLNVILEDTKQIKDDTFDEMLLLMREMEKQKQDMDRQYKNMQEQFENLKGIVDQKVGEEEMPCDTSDTVQESKMPCDTSDTVQESKNTEMSTTTIKLLYYFGMFGGALAVVFCPGPFNWVAAALVEVVPVVLMVLYPISKLTFYGYLLFYIVIPGIFGKRSTEKSTTK
jgi:hypothetical protein